MKIDETLSLVKELHSHSIINGDTYYSEKLLQIIINLSSIGEVKNLENTATSNQAEIAKVKRKVPKWMKKTHQYNYLILKAFIDLSNYNENRVPVDKLEEYVNIGKAFLANYNNLKTISEKNHGKVFDEIDREVELWEPVAEFIEDVFEENGNMNKKKASAIINNDLCNIDLDSSNHGNVKWANKNLAKNVYWINVHIDKRIKEKFHFILNDKDTRQFIHMIIPPNTFTDDVFASRVDKTNGLDKYDIELSNSDVNYLHDIKFGNSNFDFSQFVVKKYKY